jgi:hypothetical protein
MAAPGELRRALSKAEPKLEIAYLRSRELGRGYHGISDIERSIFAYQGAVAMVFGGAETDVKQVLTTRRVRELGIRSDGEAIELGEARALLPQPDIISRRAPYLLLTRDGRVAGVIDRMEWVSRIATVALQ